MEHKKKTLYFHRMENKAIFYFTLGSVKQYCLVSPFFKVVGNCRGGWSMRRWREQPSENFMEGYLSYLGVTRIIIELRLVIRLG